MSKDKSQTVTQMLDPASQQYVSQYLRPYALSAAGLPPMAPGMGQGPSPFARNLGFGGGFGGAGFAPWMRPPQTVNPNVQATLPPEILAAQAGLQNYAQLGQQGVTALGGGVNPFYDSARAQALNPIFDQQRAQALQAVGDQAQGYGAYGGSRQGVAEGVALGQVGQNQAQLQYQAYIDSLQRALAAAGMGMGAGAAGALLPQNYFAGQLGLLNQGLGPTGSTQTQTMHGDPFSQLLGSGLSIGSLFMPGGLLAKGAMSGAGTQVMGGFPSYPDFG